MKNLYKLKETATNEFDKQIFKMMNENFRKYEIMILRLINQDMFKLNNFVMPMS